GGVVVAVPPEPVRALGDIKLIPGACEDLRPVNLPLRFGHEELAGHVQRVPGAIVLGVPHPDREVVADPAPPEEPGPSVRRGMLAEELADGRRLDPWVAHGPLIERAEKRDPPVGIILPAVLAVEDHRNNGRWVVPAGVSDRVELAEEVMRGALARTPLVVEAD